MELGRAPGCHPGCVPDRAASDVTPPDQWSKLDKIRYLLDQWDVIHDPNVTAPLGVSDGGSVALMPLMSRHASVLELGRVLGLLLWANPGDYRHLIAYRQCEWRVVWVPTRIRGPHGKLMAGDPRPERRRVLHPWLKMARVHRAESFLEHKFRGDVFIPDELWHSLNCPGCAKCQPAVAA